LNGAYCERCAGPTIDLALRSASAKRKNGNFSCGQVGAVNIILGRHVSIQIKSRARIYKIENRYTYICWMTFRGGKGGVTYGVTKHFLRNFVYGFFLA